MLISKHLFAIVNITSPNSVTEGHIDKDQNSVTEGHIDIDSGRVRDSFDFSYRTRIFLNM
jgi:hypothetical protein